MNKTEIFLDRNIWTKEDAVWLRDLLEDLEKKKKENMTLDQILGLEE